MSRKLTRPTDRWRIIRWLEEDLEYYKNNIGKVKEYGKTLYGRVSTTVINQQLIDAVEKRIKQLKEKELELV